MRHTTRVAISLPKSLNCLQVRIADQSDVVGRVTDKRLHALHPCRWNTQSVGKWELEQTNYPAGVIFRISGPVRDEMKRGLHFFIGMIYKQALSVQRYVRWLWSPDGKAERMICSAS